MQNLPGVVPLPTDEAHHALRVLRLRPDETVVVFDGQGYSGEGRFEALNKREAVVHVEDIAYTAPTSPAFTLLQANLQRDKTQESVIRHATELGVARLVFFEAARSVRAKKARSDKWQRIAVETCKQCGRVWLPELRTAESLSAALDEAQGPKLLLSLEQAPVPIASLFEGETHEQGMTLLVGPEGDFTPEEENLLAKQCTPISLGSYVYRAEVAAFLGLALLQYHAGQLGPLR